MSLSFCGPSQLFAADLGPSQKGQLNPPSYPHCPEEDYSLGMPCPNLSTSASSSPSTGTRNAGPKSPSLKGLPLSPRRHLPSLRSPQDPDGNGFQ